MNKPRKIFALAAILLGIIVVLTACNIALPGAPANPPQEEPLVDDQGTQDAMVSNAVEGTATQLAVEGVVEQPALPETGDTAAPEASETPDFTNTPEITATPAPTETTGPTQTPMVRFPTVTRTQTPVVIINQPGAGAVSGPPTAVPCNGATFLADVTVRDGTIFDANANFTKTWRLKNTGTCTWTETYDVVFLDGVRMGAPTVVDLPKAVRPGQEVEISVGMVAPNSAGNYRGNWKLRDDKGVTFGVGRNAPFYVDIIVKNSATAIPRRYIYDFAKEYCASEWGNTLIYASSTTPTPAATPSGRLPCPGAEGDKAGFVLRYERPQLETGQIDDEAALLLNPEAVTDGIIRGRSPILRIEAGYHFRALVGCDYSANNCNVKVRVDYQIGDETPVTLGTWTETRDGQYTSINLDLSSLAGKDIRLILIAMANGEMNQDRSLWLAPRIDN